MTDQQQLEDDVAAMARKLAPPNGGHLPPVASITNGVPGRAARPAAPTPSMTVTRTLGAVLDEQQKTNVLLTRTNELLERLLEALA